MTIRNVHEQMRHAILHRINQGTLSQKLLAHLTNISASHISSFLHGRKRLSAELLDQVMRATGFRAELLPIPAEINTAPRKPRLPGGPGRADVDAGTQSPARNAGREAQAAQDRAALRRAGFINP